MQLNPVTLSFVGGQSDLDASFHSSFFERNLRHLRLCHFTAIFFLGTWIYVDFLMYPDKLAPFVLIKLVLMTAFALGLLFTTSPLYKDLYQVVSGGFVVLVGMGFCWMIVLEGSGNIYPLVFGITFSYIFNYVFIRLHFVKATVSGLILLGICIFSLYLIRLDAPPEVLKSTLYYLVMLNLLGMVVSYTMERSSRRQHFLSAELEEERDRQFELNDRLKDALEEIKALRGILPICANCKKIRDDDGFWQRVEVYIEKHTDALFSHGICSECLDELYPELSEGSDPPDSGS